MKTLRTWGVSKVFLMALPAYANIFRAYEEKKLFGVQVTLIVGEGWGSWFSSVHDQLEDTFVLLTRNTLANISLAPVVRHHHQSEADVTLALVPFSGQVSLDQHMDIVHVDNTGRVCSLQENSQNNTVGAHASLPANSGIYIVSKESLYSRTYSERGNDGFSFKEEFLLPTMEKGTLFAVQPADAHVKWITATPSTESSPKVLKQGLARGVAFLDRDGVINIDHGYTYDPNQLQLTKTAAQAIGWLNQKNYLVCVVTNQAGVALGYYSEGDVRKFHEALTQELWKKGAYIDAFLYCPFDTRSQHPYYGRASRSRKPGDGMLRRAASLFTMDRTRSFLIGDRTSDLEAAASFGIPAHLVESNVCDLERVVRTIATAKLK